MNKNTLWARDLLITLASPEQKKILRWNQFVEECISFDGENEFKLPLAQIRKRHGWALNEWKKAKNNA